MDQNQEVNELAQCASCNNPIAEDNAEEHPWLYGLVCLNCLMVCKQTVTKWARADSYQCEDCSSSCVENLTICNYRLLCFACNVKDLYLSHNVRYDWKEKVLSMQIDMGLKLREKRPLRVLSLFDGIGTGLFVLDSLGLEVDEYFSCENDSSAIAVLNFHFHGRIKHLGNVSNLSYQKLRSLGHIDLVLGGSPCNQLSLANPNRKGLYDPQDTGVLFFDFDRVLKFLQASAACSGKSLFWLYENVSSMPHDFQDTISKTLNCKPAKWDAIQFLPAKRERLFWGNIPNLHSPQGPNTPPLQLDDILEPYRKATVDTLRTLTTTFHSQLIGKEMHLPVIEDGEEDGLLITERERLFGFPSHYTDGPDLSIRQRQCLLGRAWSVPVIKSIFFPLTKIYKMKD